MRTKDREEVLVVLRRAREYLAAEDGWCRMAHTRVKPGRPYTDDPFDYSYCILGAIQRAGAEKWLTNRVKVCIHELYSWKDVMDYASIESPEKALAEVNDYVYDQKAVVSLFNRTIDRIEREILESPENAQK